MGYKGPKNLRLPWFLKHCGLNTFYWCVLLQANQNFAGAHNLSYLFVSSSCQSANSKPVDQICSVTNILPKCQIFKKPSLDRVNLVKSSNG